MQISVHRDVHKSNFVAQIQTCRWTFFRLCPAKLCSLLITFDITASRLLEQSPVKSDRVPLAPSQPVTWQCSGHTHPRENKSPDFQILQISQYFTLALIEIWCDLKYQLFLHMASVLQSVTDLCEKSILFPYNGNWTKILCSTCPWQKGAIFCVSSSLFHLHTLVQLGDCFQLVYYAS